MKYPKNELAQLVIASCVSNHIQEVVISPGSRNAPLTIGFHQIPSITAYSVVDERCAAFVALGMAQQTQKAAAVVCTSGSAALNYYPAVAEAFYADIPLVVITADRPKHLIDVGDGQTIRQEGVYKNHILLEANLVAIKTEVDRAFNKALIYQAIQTANRQKGPVHINVPFEEPLYELTHKMLSFPMEQLEFQETPLTVKELEPFAKKWNAATKKMVLIGVCPPSNLLQTQIRHLLKDTSVVVLTETTSNIENHNTIHSIDQFLAGLTEEEKKYFQPDILITIGGLVVSKRIKQYFRSYAPKAHWAVHPTQGYNTFFCLTKHFKLSAELFFSQFFWLTKNKKSSFQSKALQIKAHRKQLHKKFVASAVFSDFKVYAMLNKSLPENSVLQLSNSATVRYAQLFAVGNTMQVYCNRGTSGIDGSTATAIGFAIKTKKQVVFITGDVSFLYDSNALWNTYIPINFRIVIVNNNGGGIFKILPGPKNTDALSYFETPHGYTAEHLAKMYNFEYASACDEKSLTNELASFYKEGKQPKILEVFTPSDGNDKVLKCYFETFKK